MFFKSPLKEVVFKTPTLTPNPTINPHRKVAAKTTQPKLDGTEKVPRIVIARSESTTPYPA